MPPRAQCFCSAVDCLPPPSGAGKGVDLSEVISDLGFVQLDSVNTFARAHDLILWSRRQQYCPSGLQNALARDRDVFEHWTHDAAAIDMNLYPHWKLKFARDAKLLASRWRDTRRGDLMTKIDEVLRQVSDHGCCTSGDVGLDEVRGKSGWWDWHPSKIALEYLWRSDQLSVARRDGFKKVYDLTERVIPAEQINAYASEADTVHWACGAALDKLGFATTGELAAFWDIVTPAEAKAWGMAAIADGTAVWVDVEDAQPVLGAARMSCMLMVGAKGDGLKPILLGVRHGVGWVLIHLRWLSSTGPQIACPI